MEKMILKNLKVPEALHRKVKMHAAKTKQSILLVTINALQKEIKNDNQKKSID